MNKKPILIILAIVLLAHTNVLFNDFVGDDEIVIVKNEFYRSLTNIPRLFSKDYLTQDVNILVSTEEDKSSGSIAYRPVLSLTYFVDYWIWKLNPFGYHLTNLMLHIFNSYLLYLLISTITRNPKVAFLGATLFAVHPIQSEAVCSIGYRADVLSVFFVLLSLSSFVRFRRIKKEEDEIYALLFFFLALFTKESAIVLPVLVFAYDWILDRKNTKSLLKRIKGEYRGYILITVFYLYLYFFVFRNTTLNVPKLLGASLSTHGMVMSEIFVRYMANFIFPFTVNILPPQYAPPLDNLALLKVFLALAIVILIIYFIIKTRRSSKPVSFFLFWFMVAYLPVSNIIPIPNPMAHRFLYLPSVGLLTVLAILIDKMCSNPKNFKHHPNLAKIVPFAIISICLSVTIPLNRFWKNNYTVAKELIRAYPNHPQGYLIMGLGLFKLGLFDETKLVMNKAVNLGLIDPRAYHVLGVSYADQPEVAKGHFETAIRLFPRYSLSYAGLGRLYTFAGEYTKALPYLKKSLELTPTYAGYGYTLQCLLFLKRLDEAHSVYEESKKNIQDEGLLRSLKNILDLGKKIKEPIDIGL